MPRILRLRPESRNWTDPLAENVSCDVEIAEIKAEAVKLRDNNEENKQLTFLQIRDYF